MSLNLFLLIASIAIVALVAFLVITLIRFNRFLDKSTMLLDNLNENVPPLMADLRSTGATINMISETVAQGVDQAAAGVARTFSWEGVIDLMKVAVQGIQFLRTILKRRDKG